MLTRRSTSPRRGRNRHPHRPTPILAEGRTLREPPRPPRVAVIAAAAVVSVFAAWAAWSLARQGEEILETLHQAEADRLVTAVTHATTGPID